VLSILPNSPILAQVSFTEKQPWSIGELSNVLVKAISHVIKQVTTKLGKKGPKETERQIIDEKIGLRLQQLAQLHGVNTMVS
jgi:hypothetical protein